MGRHKASDERGPGDFTALPNFASARRLNYDQLSCAQWPSGYGLARIPWIARNNTGPIYDTRSRK